jgi:hypothetical protein
MQSINDSGLEVLSTLLVGTHMNGLQQQIVTAVMRPAAELAHALWPLVSAGIGLTAVRLRVLSGQGGGALVLRPLHLPLHWVRRTVRLPLGSLAEACGSTRWLPLRCWRCILRWQAQV